MTARLPLRAPREDGAIVAEPPLDQVGSLLADNRRRLAAHTADILGLPASRLRLVARTALLESARDYLGIAAGSSPELPILMAGHQPELFHPGVWVKHFALAGLARRHGAVAVNLVVDNDTAKTTAIRVPASPDASHPWPRLVTVPFDHWNGEVPFEEATVRDEAMFDTLADRVNALMRGWDFEPLLDEYWKDVRHQAHQTPLLGERLVRARRLLEQRWGCHNLEVPVSRVCRGEAFAHFAGHLLVDLPRFHALYNATVNDYRRRHGLRSRSHPVPDLGQEGEWLEAPFWAWRTGQMRRSRLLARLSGSGLELRAGADAWPTLPWEPGRPESLVRAWMEMENSGLKVRSRALTNTLYARVFLGDLFLHGIGGGKYDELTNELIRRFYGLEPPGFLVLSATRLLPLPAYASTPSEQRRLAHLLRDLHWNPERHLPSGAWSDPGVQELAGEKRQQVRLAPADSAARRERFRALRAVNEQLRECVKDEVARVGAELERCELELASSAVLRRRDYGFCLYPESVLKPFCTQFLS